MNALSHRRAYPVPLGIRVRSGAHHPLDRGGRLGTSVILNPGSFVGRPIRTTYTK